MKHIAFLLALSATASFADNSCISFDKQDYCLVWASVDGATTSNEYLRSGDSIDAWARMITVKEYADTKELKDVLPIYMGNVRPYLAMKPDILIPNEKKHRDEAMLLLLLLAPDKSHYEYVAHQFFVDGDGPVRSTAFSLRIPFAKNVSFDEVMENRDRWMEELAAVDRKAVTAVPSPSNQPSEPTR